MSGPDPRAIRVGLRLRDAREARGLSIRQVSEATRLSVRVLTALEEHRPDELPPGIYRRSAVRTFATEVGLDPEATLLAFLREHPDQLPMPGTAMATLIGPTRPSQMPRLFGWLGAVVPAMSAVAYLVLAFGMPGETGGGAPVTLRLAEPTAPLLERRVAYVAPTRLTLTTSEATRLTVIADGAVETDRVLPPGTPVEAAFTDTLEIQAEDGGLVQVQLADGGRRPLGAAGRPLSLTLTRETYADALGLR